MFSRLLFLALLLLAACAPTITGPKISSSKDDYSIILADSAAKSWSALVDYAGGTFFSIEAFEKESGLMTLSFGVSHPEKFIDCGHIKANNLSGVDAPTVQEFSRTVPTRLTGKMNIVLKELGPYKSLLRVNARYVYQATFPEITYTWSFDTTTSDTLTDLGIFGIAITCAPTHEAERAVLAGVQERLAGRGDLQ